MNDPQVNPAIPVRIARMDLPERSGLIGMSLRQSERALEANSADKNLVDLTYANTKRFPPPAWAIEAFTAAATTGGQTYTPYRGHAAVRAIVAENVSRFLDLPVDPDRTLMLTPGTQSGLFAAVAAIVEKGSRVALADPDYLTNERILRFFGATVDHVPVIWEHGGEPTLDLERLETAFKEGARAFVFSNPNNPTGSVYGPDTLQRVAELAIQHDVLVVVDELYSRLIYDNKPFFHLARFDGMQPRTITLLGPSKTESMSGYRVGIAVGPEKIIERMEDVQSVTALRAPAYAQHTLKHWLADDEDFVAKRTRDYQKLRDYTVDRLRQTGIIEVVPSAGTTYLFPRIAGIEATDQAVALALQNHAGVIVNPGYQSGPRGIGHFRICFAQDPVQYEGIMDRVCAALLSM